MCGVWREGCRVQMWVMCYMIVSPCNSIYRVETASYANSYWGGYSSPWWDYFNSYGGVPAQGNVEGGIWPGFPASKRVILSCG